MRVFSVKIDLQGFDLCRIFLKLSDKLAEIDEQINRYASDFVKLTELSALKEKTEQELAEAEERWLYLTDLAERIEAQKKN